MAIAALLCASASASAAKFEQPQLATPKFGPPGTALTKFGRKAATIAAVASQPDGSTLAVGTLSTERRDRIVVARFTPQGLIDPGFGRRIIEFGGPAFASDIEVQPDGKIVVGASVRGSGSSSTGRPYDFALARLFPSGAIDTGFASAGIARIDFGADDGLTDIVLMPDGRLLLAGGADFGYPDRANPDSRFALTMLQETGALDPGFGTGGKVLTSLSRFAYALSVTVRPDGLISAGGFQTADPGTALPSNVAQARYSPTGVLDATFGSGGTVLTSLIPPGTRKKAQPFEPSVSDAIYDDHGRLLITSDATVLSRKSPPLTRVLRFSTDGALDLSFGSGGFASFRQSRVGSPRAIAAKPTGQVVISGGGSGLRGGLVTARLNPDGTLDTAFGKRGAAKTELDDYMVEGGPVVAFDLEGRTIVGGSIGSAFLVARFGPLGGADRTFGNGRKLTSKPKKRAKG